MRTAIPLYKRALLVRAKILRRNVLGAKRGRMVLVEVLAEAGVHVSLVELRGWTRAEQGDAYLWAKGLHPTPPKVLTDAVNRAVYNRLWDAGVHLYPEEVVRWTAKQKRIAYEWADAFALGQEDLPEPEFLADAPRKGRGNLAGRILA